MNTERTSAVQVPKVLKPGGQLTVDFGNYNRFKYKSAVQTTYFYREFSMTVAATTPPTTPAPPAAPAGAAAVLVASASRLSGPENAQAAQQALTELTRLTDAYKGYRALVGELSKLYSQDYWPGDPAAQLNTLANQAFGPGFHSLTAGQFVDQLAQWQQELAQAQATYTAQATVIANTMVRQRRTQRAQPAFDQARQRATDYPPQRAETSEADQVQAEITRWLAREAKAPILPTLATAYVALRDAQPGPVLEYLPIPPDKDELDLELKLLPRDDYHAPPGSTLVPAPTPYKKTIFLVPRFRITASVGPYVGWLFDHQYVLADDSLQLAGGTYGKRRRIVRDNADQHFEYLGATVLTHFEYRFAPSWGAALSLGAGVQAAGFRALVGPSLLIGNGQRGVLTGGLVLGQVKRLSSLYQDGEKIPVSVQTVPTREVNAASWFVALTYNLRSERK